MATPDIATKEDLAHEIASIAREVAAAESLLAHVDSVLTAIYAGGLLDRVPEEETARNMHNAAMHLLSWLVDDLKKHEDRPGTDPSISLEVLAKDVEAGRFANRRVLEA